MKPEDLKTIKSLGNLTEADLEKISLRLQPRKYDKGSHILVQGGDADCVFFILDGTVRATMYSEDGKKVSFQDLDSGEMFGEVAVIDGLDRSTGVVALSETRIAIASVGTFNWMVDNFPGFSRSVFSKLASTVRFLCERVYEFRTMTTKDRIRSELVRTAEQHMTADNSAFIPKLPPHDEIANRTATHRELVTKTITDLAKLGVLQRKGHGIVVPDIQKLAECDFPSKKDKLN